jgi:Ti-type conjugative transfer relaxase TraA
MSKKMRDKDEHIKMTREFVEREFTSKGIPADVNIHYHSQGNPHAHIFHPLRTLDENGFSPTKKDYNEAFPVEWKGRGIRMKDDELFKTKWATYQNEYYQREGHDLVVIENDGEFVAQVHMGKSAKYGKEESDVAVENERRRQENLERIQKRPEIILDRITKKEATFTDRDIQRELAKHVDDPQQYQNLLARIGASDELVKLSKGEEGNARYTTKDMVDLEARIITNARDMDANKSHSVDEYHKDLAIERMNAKILKATDGEHQLSGEQVNGIRHILDNAQYKQLRGYAGAGKSTIMEAAKDAWEMEGYRVRGMALSGIAAENLEESGIQSQTIASFEYGVENARKMREEMAAKGRELTKRQREFIQKAELTNKDVIVVDEASMIGSRQFDRLQREARLAGAKIVVIGDEQQAQAIEAGAPFRTLTERLDTAELTEVRRQNEDWQKEATKAFSENETADALKAYDARGHVHFVESHGASKEVSVDLTKKRMVDDYMKDIEARPEKTRILMAHRNVDVEDLNKQVRDRMKERGQLKDGENIKTEYGTHDFAKGDRILFRENNRDLGVNNGTTGTIEKVKDGQISVKTDKGKSVQFDSAEYSKFQHGYAATIHKEQGVTVDEAKLLASRGLDRNLTLVGMSRHKDKADLYAADREFKDISSLSRSLSKDGSSKTVADYVEPVEKKQTVPAHVKEKRQKMRERWKAESEELREKKRIDKGGNELSKSQKVKDKILDHKSQSKNPEEALQAMADRVKLHNYAKTGKAKEMYYTLEEKAKRYPEEWEKVSQKLQQNEQTKKLAQSINKSVKAASMGRGLSR